MPRLPDSVLGLTTTDELRTCPGFPPRRKAPTKGPAGWMPTSAVIRACPGVNNKHCGQLVPANRQSQFCENCESIRSAARAPSTTPELFLCPGPEMEPEVGETCGRMLPTRERCDECKGRREWLRKQRSKSKRAQPPEQRNRSPRSGTIRDWSNPTGW